MADTPEEKPEQRGKRGDPTYTQVAGMVSLERRRLMTIRFQLLVDTPLRDDAHSYFNSALR